MTPVEYFIYLTYVDLTNTRAHKIARDEWFDNKAEEEGCMTNTYLTELVLLGFLYETVEEHSGKTIYCYTQAGVDFTKLIAL